MPTEKETFGEVTFWMEFHIPKEDFSLGRARRDVYSISSTSINTSSITNSRLEISREIKKLDLHLMSNCTVDRAELIVSECAESKTEDFSQSVPILTHG